MRHTTTTATSSTGKSMGNGNKKSLQASMSVDEIPNASSTKHHLHTDVSQWSSSDVQQWIKQQCKKFELKKGTADKFEMNGQALALLTKHDFIRRSPDGGEVLYYALQRLINPGKATNGSIDRNALKSPVSNQHPRIVEVSNDIDASNNPVDSSSYPIVEEPDDPPKIRRSQSEGQANSADSNPSAAHHIFMRHFHRPMMMNMGPAMATGYFHQHPGMPPAFVFAQQPPVQMIPPNYFHPQIFQHYHQLLTGQGILIEMMDEPTSAHVPSNAHQQQQLYLVTMDGQRVIMNEVQVRQLLAEIQRRQQFQHVHPFHEQR